jgi:membrane-associated phospholipid phosphatase
VAVSLRPEINMAMTTMAAAGKSHQRINGSVRATDFLTHPVYNEQNSPSIYIYPTGEVFMNFDSGIALILAIQNIGGWLEAPLRFFTFLGTENFYLLILPILYWCVDANLGMRVGVILLLGSGINDIFKLALHSPRPYWVSAQVKALSAEPSFGAPSGHAQSAVGVWGMLASFVGKTWFWVVAIVVAFLIGFSRMYLGVHFWGDVWLGWLIGALILFLVLRLWDSVGNWVAKKSLAVQATLAFVVSLTMILLGAFFVYGLRDYSLPPEWMTNAARASDVLPAPVSMKSIITSAATLFGLALGAAWMRQMGGFQASGPVERRALRYIVGLVGVAILWYGLGEIFPSDEALVPYILRFIRYVLVGLWVSGGAPWLFLRFKLAEPSNR